MKLKIFTVVSFNLLFLILGYVHEQNIQAAQPLQIHYNQETKISKEFYNCLLECYQVDPKSASTILSKITPLLENDSHASVLSEFINKSKNLSLTFKDIVSLPTKQIDDPVLKAPKWHEILFENEHFRILWGFTKAGEQEPYHIHQLKSIMLIVQGASFKIENADGTIENGDWLIGVYVLPPDSQPFTITNTGSTDFKALRFELKE